MSHDASGMTKRQVPGEEEPLLSFEKEKKSA